MTKHSAHGREQLNIQHKIDDITGDNREKRLEVIRQNRVKPVDMNKQLETFTPIVDDIFDMEKEKFIAEKAAFKALNTNLTSKKPNPKLITMVLSPRFPKLSVKIEAKIDKMSTEELISLMKKSNNNKSEV